MIENKYKRSLVGIKYFGYMLFALSLFLYIVGELIVSYHLIQFSLIFIIFFLVTKYGNRNNAAVFAFIICFVMLLVNRILLSMIDPAVTISLQEDIETMMHLHRCLYLSLLFLNIGVSQWHNVSIKIVSSKAICDDFRIGYIQSVSKTLFYLTSMFHAAELLEKVIYVILRGGYLNYYVSFSSSLPGVIHKLGNLNEILFFIFLSTLPDPRKNKTPFILFGSFGLLTLLYGQRNGIVTAVIMIAVYIIIYENITDQRYSIITKRMYRIAVISIPFLFFALNAVTIIRSGNIDSSGGVLASIETFMENTGNSIRVIIFGYKFDAQIGHDKIYSLGKLTEFFKNNYLVKVLTGGTYIYSSSVGQTEDIALNGYSFGAIVTYLYSKSAYLAGHGLGSCYIAEVFHDFGYVGICIVNIIYGKVLKKVPEIIGNSWVVNSIVLLSFYNLLLAPRSLACGFLASFINFQFLISIVAVYICANIIKTRSSVEVSSFSESQH